MANGFVLDDGTLDSAAAASFNQKADASIWSLGFDQRADKQIDSLALPSTQDQQWTPHQDTTQGIAGNPLPIVVSPIPQPMDLPQRRQPAQQQPQQSAGLPGSVVGQAGGANASADASALAAPQQGGAGPQAAGGASAAMPTGGGPAPSGPGQPFASNEERLAYVADAARRNGHDPAVAQAVARSEGAGAAGTVGDNGTSFGALQAHVGGGQGDDFRQQTGLDPSDPRNERALIDWQMAQVGQTGWAPFHGAAAAGIGQWQGIGTGAAPSQAAYGAGSDVSSSQQAAPRSGAAGAAYSGPYTQQALADAGDPDAWAKCGPVAAYQFALKTGRSPTPAEAEKLARDAGWTPQQGMAGLSSEAAVLKGMGIAAHPEDGVDWNKVITDVSRGNPVILQLPGHDGHYITAQGYDAQTGKIDFGSTVGDLRAAGHKTQFTPSELEGLGWGAPNASLYLDNPATPAPSVAAGRSAPTAGTPRPAESPPSSPPAAAPPTPVPSAGGAPPLGSGPITVRDQWGNTWQTTQERLNQRPGGYSDLTIVPQAAAAPQPDALRTALNAPSAAPMSLKTNAPTMGPDTVGQGQVPSLPPERNGVREWRPGDPQVSGGTVPDAGLRYPIDQRYPGQQPGDVTGPDGEDRTNDPLLGGGSRWPDDPRMPQAPGPLPINQNMQSVEGTGQMYRQPLGGPNMGPDTTTDAPPTSTYNDPTADGTQTQPLPAPQPDYQYSQGDQQFPPTDYQPTPIKPAQQNLDISYAQDTGVGDYPGDQYQQVPIAPRTAAPAAYGASSDDPGAAPYQPPVAQQPAPQIAQQSMVPDLKPVWDAAGQVIGYVKHGAEAAKSGIQAAGEGIKTAATAIAPYIQPAGGLPEVGARIRDINDQAARDQGKSPTDVRAMFQAADDPAWRAQNPDLAAEYDALQNQYTMGVGGVVNPVHETASPSAAQGIGSRLGEGAAPIARTAEALPALPDGHVRVIHTAPPAHAEAIAQNGLDYSGLNDITNTAVRFDRGQDVSSAIPYGNDPSKVSVVMDMPRAEYERHLPNHPPEQGGERRASFEMPGVVDPKYVVGVLPTSELDRAGALARQGVTPQPNIGTRIRGALGANAERVPAPGEMSLGSGFVPSAERGTVHAAPEGAPTWQLPEGVTAVKTPISAGLSSGYSPDDIRAFYLNRRWRPEWGDGPAPAEVTQAGAPPYTRDRAAQVAEQEFQRDLRREPPSVRALVNGETLPPGEMQLGSGVVPRESGRRMYHGTAGEFGRPDPGKFDQNGLFGPGYYLTSDPRVASSYAIEKGGRANGSMGVTAAGLTFKTPEGVAEVLGIRQRGLADAEQRLAAMADDPPSVYGGGPKTTLRRQIEVAKQNIRELEQAHDTLTGVTSGPNIRAVDVPEGLTLFDAEGEIDPVTVGREILPKLGKRQRASVGQALDNAEYTANENLRSIDVYDALSSVLGKDGANRILKRVGYDGITHTGGSVMPIMDADGNPIEHAVTVVFPGSLDKIRNAFSGEAGGAGFVPSLSPGLRAAAFNAAQGGVVGDLAANQEDQRRQDQGLPPMSAAERAAYIAGGGTLAAIAGNRAARGAVGRALGSGFVGRGANIEARIASAADQLASARRALDGADSVMARAESASPAEFAAARRAYGPARQAYDDAQRAYEALQDEQRAVSGRIEQAGYGQPIQSAGAGTSAAANETAGAGAIPRTVDDTPRTVSLGSGFVSRSPGTPPVPQPTGPLPSGLGNVPPSQVKAPQLPGMQSPAPTPIGHAVQQIAGLTPAQNVNVGQAIQSAAQQAQSLAARGITRPSVWDWIKATGYAGIYSPATAVASGVQGATELALAQPKEALRALTQGRPGAYGQQVKAQVGALGEGMAGLGKVLSEAVMGDAAGAAAASGGSRGTVGLSERVINPAGHAAARALEIPGEILTEAPDAVFRPLFRAQGSTREAQQVASEMGMRGQQAATYANSLMQDAQAVRSGQLPVLPQTQRVIDAGDKYADELGYKGKPGGFGQWLATQAKRDDPIGVAAQFLMPFPAMASRMTAAGAKITPGSALLPGVRKMYPSKFDMIYDQALGTTLAAGVGYWAMNGGITGSGPTDPQARKEMTDQGWQPNSTLVGGYYIPNRVFGRFQPFLDTAGELHDALAYGKPDRTAPQITSELVARGSKIATDQVGLSGLADLHDMLANGFSSQFPGFAARSATRYVPAGGVIRALAASLDPNQRRADPWKEGSPLPAIGEQVKTAVPWVRQSVPAAQDVLGRPAPNPQQGLGAIIPRTTTLKNDPTIRIFQDAGVDIGGPKQEIRVTKSTTVPPMPLTPDEQRVWNTARGAVLIDAGRELSRDPDWASAPPEAKQKTLQKILDTAAKAADGQVLDTIGDDEITRRIDRIITQKAS